VQLYDPDTGRCADGLDRHGASDNAGAESTICALLALLALQPVASRGRLSAGRHAGAHRLAGAAASLRPVGAGGLPADRGLVARGVDVTLFASG
jgi:hypothetical protein